MLFLNIYPNQHNLYVHDNNESAIQGFNSYSAGGQCSFAWRFSIEELKIQYPHFCIYDASNMNELLHRAQPRSVVRVGRYLNVYNMTRELVIHPSATSADTWGVRNRDTTIAMFSEQTNEEILAAYPGWFVRDIASGEILQERSPLAMEMPSAVKESISDSGKVWLNIYEGKKNTVYIHSSKEKAIEQGDTSLGIIARPFEGTLQEIRIDYASMKVMSHVLGKTFEPIEEPFGC